VPVRTHIILHIFYSFFFSCVPVWSRAKKKLGEEKRGLYSSHLAILSLAHTPEHYTNMVKHNNEIPHQHFKKDWQGYAILSFYAASIIRVLENARRNAFIFSLFCFTRTNLRIHPFFYYRNCSQSFVRTWFNQAGRKKSRRIGTFIQFLFELRHRGWRVWVHFRPSHFALSSANKALSPKFSLVSSEISCACFLSLTSFSFSLFANLNSTREESEGYLPAPGLWCFETGGPMPNAKIQL